MGKLCACVKPTFVRRTILFVFLIMLLALSGCQRKTGLNIPEESSIPESSEGQVKDFTAVVTNVDVKAKKLSLYQVNLEQEIVFDYSGGTYFVSKNGSQMTAAQMEQGEVVDIYADGETGALSKVQVSSDAFLENNIQDVVVNTNENYISFQGKKFRYRKGMVIFSGNKKIDIMEVSSDDVVTIRGVTGYIYSIVVEKGHGYIRPVKYNDFIGGKMTIEGEAILEIKDKMLIPIREGTYEVTMKKGDFIGTRSIAVFRDAETDLDMSVFKSQKPNMGQVIFDVSPEGALVYVDGKEVDVSSPVTLKYGVHKVSVVLEGYISYSGTLDVQSANPTVRVDLADESANVKDKSSPAPEGTSPPVYDNEHKITVSEPVSVEVYLNGVYKDVSPVSFAKIIGKQTITLRKTGYIPKSYTVEIIDDDEDILWNFPALVKKADS